MCFLEIRYFLFSLYLSIRVFPLPRFPSTPVSLTSFKYFGGAGISTCYPSATPFGLTLGPDLPWADEPSPGNLRLTATGILTLFFVTQPKILTSSRSSTPYGIPSLQLERSPTAQNIRRYLEPAASVVDLAPNIFGAGPLD